MSSNRSTGSSGMNVQERLRLTQEELSFKLKELQIHEQNYLHQKKEITKWKKKFEEIFHENELLSLESSKLEAANKQIIFLQQEIQFKEEESQALRGLVTALEASNKKARATCLASVSNLRNNTKKLPPAVIVAANLLENGLITKHADLNDSRNSSADWRDSSADDKYLIMEKEIETLKSENSGLLSDLDQKQKTFQSKEDQIIAQKERIDCLETQLKQQQNLEMEKMKKYQEKIKQLEQKIYMDRINADADADADGDADADHENADDFVDHHPNTDQDRPQDKTLPGTHPPIGQSSLLPSLPSTIRSTSSGRRQTRSGHIEADEILRDWEVVKKKHFSTSKQPVVFEQDQVDTFLARLPFESKDGATRILLNALDNTREVFQESQLVLRHVSSETQKQLENYLIPLFESSYPHIRVTYMKMLRCTTATDLKLILEPRDLSCLGDSEAAGSGKTIRFGRDHAFLGPSADDPSKLVRHMPRTLTRQNKAIYISKPQVQAHQEEKQEEEVEVENGQDGGEESGQQQHHEENVLDSLDRENRISGAILSPKSSSSFSSSSSTFSSTINTNAFTNNTKWFMAATATATNRLGTTTKLMGTMAFAATKKVTAKLNQHTLNKYVHDGTRCQVCNTGPIQGFLYRCTTCEGYDLCQDCYEIGGHGLENSDELFQRVLEIVTYKCPPLGKETELLELLRYEICRSNLRKFQFCVTWLTDIVMGKTVKELKARALEIPSIRRDIRKQFVPLLMMIVSDREDLEVKTEWELENDNLPTNDKRITGTGSNSTASQGGDGRFLETLRIWVADQYCTTSPFVERTLMKYRKEEEQVEQEEEQEEEQEDVEEGSACTGEENKKKE